MRKKFAYLFIFLASLSSLIISVVLFIQSFEKYDDGYGIDYSFNLDYAVALFVSLFITLFIIYIIYCNKKNIPHQNEEYLIKIAMTSLISLYSLGTFFKKLFKNIAKGIELSISSYQNYLFIGIVVLFIALYYIIKYIDDKLKK